MQPSNKQNRRNLAIEFLNELKSINLKLEQMSKNLYLNSTNCYEESFLESKSSFQAEIDKYNANVKRIETLNCEITIKINEWYEFLKDSNEIKRLTFPLRFYLNKKKLAKKINEINNTISALTIENRFINEKLIILEQEVEVKAVQETKNGESSKIYEQLLTNRSNLISDIKYLLATIPEVLPAVLDTDKADCLIEKLSQETVT